MKKVVILSALLLLMLATMVVILLSTRTEDSTNRNDSNSSSTEKNNDTQTDTPERLYGFSLSPKSFTGTDFSNFFLEAVKHSNTVAWVGSWSELGNRTKSPYVVSKLAETYSYTPLVIVGPAELNNHTAEELTDEKFDKYVADISSFAKDHQPAYIAIGVEINLLNELSPTGFARFLELYQAAYDGIKAASPDTKVFTIYQYEQLRGLKGGLFGGQNDLTDHSWELLNQIEADLIGFTSYPCLIYKDPEEIPEDYYSEISQHTTKPVAFTELGWFREISLAGWGSSEAEQARFVTRFRELTADLDPEIVIWSFYYDQKIDVEPFWTMGMLSSSMNSSLTLTAWDESFYNGIR